MRSSNKIFKCGCGYMNHSEKFDRVENRTDKDFYLIFGHYPLETQCPSCKSIRNFTMSDKNEFRKYKISLFNEEI